MRRRRHRRLHTVVFASAATMFAPQPGKSSKQFAGGDSRPAQERPPEPEVAARVYEPTAAIDITLAFRLAPSAYDPLIEEAAKRFHVDPALVRAIIRTESGFDPQAVSSAGALGLMQLMPDLAAERGVANPFDPRANIMAGVQYFSELLSLHGGDLSLALASYNAGPAVVEQYQGVPPFPETQHYIARITSLIGLAATDEQ